jgi:PAS domain S-box-containing protein
LGWGRASHFGGAERNCQVVALLPDFVATQHRHSPEAVAMNTSSRERTARETPGPPPPNEKSYAELQLIYDTAPVGLAFLSPDCRYVQINRRLTEICGLSIADHIGQLVRETVPQVADQVEKIVEAVMRTGEPVTGVEVCGQRSDKLNADHVWITNWHPLKGPDGSIVGVNVVAEEITERKRAEAVLTASDKALRESEVRFRELADNISQFAWTADQTGWIYWYNKRWYDYTGTKLEDMEGWGWQKVHHPEHVERVVRRIKESFESGTPWEDTFPLRGADGSYRWFLSRALPIRNEAGDVIRWFGTNTDITKQIEAENALRESEARFRELANNISQFAWTADQAGRRYWYNKRWYDYTGTTLEDMQGWGWQKVHHPEHVERVVQRMRESFESGTRWEDTFPLRGADGSYRWFLSRALPIRSEAGDVIRWFGTNTDITKQIEAEKALRELNETLEQRVEDETRERLQIWNVSQDLLVVADLAGKYLSVNPAWTPTLGWSNSELLGRTSQWLLHPDDQDKTYDEIGRLAAGQKTLRFESRFRHKDGSYRWISWDAAPDEDRIYAMGRDVTELKDAENLLRETRSELAQFARRTMLTAMTASIAHEINQPLAAMAANGHAGLRWLAKTEPDLDEVRQALERIVENGDRAGNIVASIRAMFRKDGPKKEPLNVNDLVRDVFALVRGELERHRIVLRSELREDLPKIVGERVPLQQVLLNLIMNAAEAMGSVTDRARVLRVSSNTIEEASGVAVTVEDSGTGIAGKDKDRIFEAFFTTKPEGMGMGLSICQSIVAAHGGRLWVTPGMPGSVFHVQLPIGGLAAWVAPRR